MISPDAFRALALAFPHAQEKPHFERVGFRVDAPKGKMFATLLTEARTANLFLSVDEQEVLIGAEPDMFSKVPNAWGDKGATMLHLDAADEATARSALALSWRRAAPAKLHGLLDGSA